MRTGYRIQYFFTPIIEFPKKIYDITLLHIIGRVGNDKKTVRREGIELFTLLFSSQ